MLTAVFAESVRTLEPGGRIAVNVANLGRKPYRSLSADVIGILQDELGLLLRGEVIWLKARGASGSCAWGSFQSPANPVLRDVTERVIIASKGRFDRALSRQSGRRSGSRPRSRCPRTSSSRPPPTSGRSAPRGPPGSGHPAPFPVELPQRLIELYTYRRRSRARPVHGIGDDGGGGRPDRTAVRGLRHRDVVRRDRRAADPGRTGSDACTRRSAESRVTAGAARRSASSRRTSRSDATDLAGPGAAGRAQGTGAGPGPPRPLRILPT